jgi:hypothetical protein
MFKSTLELKAGHIGKFVLCRVKKDIVLFGSLYKDKRAEGARNSKGQDAIDRTINDEIRHKHISRDGIIFGGAIIAVMDEWIAVWGYSVSFGPVCKAAVEQCLEGSGKKLIFGSLKDGVRELGEMPLDEWLKHEWKEM